MTPAGLARGCEEIERDGRRVLVECGSGYSTLVLARLLGGRPRAAARPHLRPLSVSATPNTSPSS
jgi:hypothetical protein